MNKELMPGPTVRAWRRVVGFFDTFWPILLILTIISLIFLSLAWVIEDPAPSKTPKFAAGQKVKHAITKQEGFVRNVNCNQNRCNYCVSTGLTECYWLPESELETN